MTESAEYLAGRRKFFVSQALHHAPELHLMFNEAKLRKREGWRNVVEHNVVVGVAANTLARLLGLPEQETENLTRTAFVHDWRKRIDIDNKKGMNEFSPEEVEAAELVLKQINPDPNILFATGPEFNKAFWDGQKSTLIQKIMFYVDDITRENDIVPLLERVNEVAARKPQFGQEFWDRERQIGTTIEKELFDTLPEATRAKVGESSRLPAFIKSEIEAHYI